MEWQKSRGRLGLNGRMECGEKPVTLGGEVIRLVSGRLSRKGVSADDWERWAEGSIMVKLMSMVMKMSGGNLVQ